MSVLIKGMKMPRSCEYCRFSGVGGLRNERVVCMFTGANAYMNTAQYLDDCPLVEVPPHGRLIDADALRELYEEWENDKAAGIYIDKCHVPTPVIRQNIDDAPTIIPAEEGE